MFLLSVLREYFFLLSDIKNKMDLQIKKGTKITHILIFDMRAMCNFLQINVHLRKSVMNCSES